jgi:hypothetical protein
MSIGVVMGNSLEIKSGLVFFIEPPLKVSPNDNMLPSFKRGGNIPTQISSQILKP